MRCGKGAARRGGVKFFLKKCKKGIDFYGGGCVTVEKISKEKSMKKRFFLSLIGVLCAFCCAFGFSACKDKNDNNDGNLGNNGGSNQEIPDESDYSYYSKLVQDVLKSDYYYNLLDFDEFSVPADPLYDPHPYGFLQAQGYDIEAIKNKSLECETICYVKGVDKNNLYVNTRVETVDNFGDYYTCYTLKYSISEREYKDIYFLYDLNAAHAAFVIQELSYQKTPKIESCASITKDSYIELNRGFNTYIKCTSQFDSGSISFDLIDFSVENQNIKCLLRTAPKSNKTIQQAQISKLECIPAKSNVQVYRVEVLKDSNIYKSPVKLNWNPEDYDKFKNNMQSITYLESQHTSLSPIENLYKDNEITK